MLEGIRPTQSIVRKTLFDILGQDMGGMSLLDLFAGSGAVGLEAISRGAVQTTFVEKDPRCAAVIEENIGLFIPKGDEAEFLPYQIVQTDAFAAIKMFSRQNKKFDVVFVDPPYSRGLAKKALKTLEAYDILQPNCVAIIQHEKREILPEKQGRFLLFRQKKFGSTVISLYKSDSENTE